MSSLICFPNKLEKPGSGVRSEFAFAGDGSKPAEDGAAGEGVDFMGASCSPDPGNEAAGECGKRLSDSLWASEDLSCSSEIRRDAPASRGSPEWTGAADAQRAISLDATECLSEMSNQALVRSAALEDLTSIGDRSMWVSQEEDGGTAGGACANPTTSRRSTPETQQPPRSPDLPLTPDSHSEDHPENNEKNISEKDRLLTDVPAENGSTDSSVHAASFWEPDISGDSDTRSDAVRTTGTAELQKTTPQTSPARRSLVPVPIVKGLFASESSSVNSSHFHLQRSCSCVLCGTLPPNPFSGRSNPRRSSLSSLPTLAFVPSLHLCSLLVMQPETPLLTFGFVFVFHQHFVSPCMLHFLHHRGLICFLC